MLEAIGIGVLVLVLIFWAFVGFYMTIGYVSDYPAPGIRFIGMIICVGALYLLYLLLSTTLTIGLA